MLTGFSSNCWTLSIGLMPFFALIKMKIVLTPGQDLKSFSQRAFPTNPLAPVTKMFFPS